MCSGVQFFLQICQTYKLTLPMDSLTTLSSSLDNIPQSSRAQTSQFTRSKLPQVLPEYKDMLRLIQTDPCVDEGTHLKDDFKANTVTGNTLILPKNSRLLTKLPDHEKGREEAGNFLWYRCTWGIQWSEFEFITAAATAGHPRSFMKSMPVDLQNTIDSLTQLTNQEVACRRANWARHWMQRRVQLEAQEKKLHERMDNESRNVMVDKKILLYEEMLKQAGYSDMNVVSIVKEGVPLVGQVQQSGHFAKTYKPAAISVEYLEQHSANIREAVMSGISSSGDKDCDAFVYNETLKERDKGWLSGPHALDELPPNAVISRRFALWQKTKYRCIDDYSGSLVNATCTIDETPFLHTIDVAGAMLSSWMQLARTNESTLWEEALI